jgi:hypothetical protein
VAAEAGGSAQSDGNVAAGAALARPRKAFKAIDSCTTRNIRFASIFCDLRSKIGTPASGRNFCLATLPRKAGLQSEAGIGGTERLRHERSSSMIDARADAKRPRFQ